MHLRSFRSLFAGLLLGAVAPFTATAAPATARADLVDTAVAVGSFKTLAAALKAADLVGALKGDGPFTVFAPTDEAFAKLPKGTLESLLRPENKDQLVAILKLHVIAARVPLAAAIDQGSANTLANERVTIAFKDGAVRVNDAKLTAADVGATNGVIHIIDRVLLPTQKAPPVAAAKMSGASPARVIALAIKRGVPLFNDGQPAACASVYELTAESLVTLGQLPPAAEKALRTALDESTRAADATERAWTLRRGLDRALTALEGHHTVMR
jgi:uncharacterized surface protein with fasciclin (FAS1) repeats